MIQINDNSFEIVYKRDAMGGNKKYAGGVIFANNNRDALMIAKQLVKDIQNRIDTKKEAEKMESLLEKYKEEKE